MSFDTWKSYKIGEIGNIVTGKTPSTIVKENFGDQFPFITPRDIIGQKRIKKTERRLSEIGFASLKNSVIPPNAICVTCIGTIGKVVMPTEVSITNQQINSIICNNQFSPDFVYYALINISKDIINKGANTTVVPIINKTDFSNFSILAPDIKTQHRIADILSGLDEKIELNRQTNATLEAIAQAIFDEWFVRFNFPGDDGERVESELGPIPQGWRVGKLGEICKLIKGVSYKSSELQPSDLALVTLKSINRGGGFNTDGFKEYSGAYKTSQRLEEGDLIFAQTDITQNADVIGSPAIVENPFGYKNLVASLDIVKCEPTNEMPSSGTLYCFLQRQEFKDYCLSQTNGSTVLHLRSSEVPNYSMIIPNSSILRRFDSIIAPIRKNILENIRQIKLLREIRDELLPKLMNGEIEV